MLYLGCQLFDGLFVPIALSEQLHIYTLVIEILKLLFLLLQLMDFQLLCSALVGHLDELLFQQLVISFSSWP